MDKAALKCEETVWYKHGKSVRQAALVSAFWSRLIMPVCVEGLRA